MQMALRLQDRRIARQGGEQDEFQNWLLQALPDLASLQTQQAADQAADNLSVSNAINSLRAIGDADWPDIIAHASALMRLMLTSPLFEAEDNITRDQSLHAIERLASRCGQTEVAVAQRLLGFTNSRSTVNPASSVAAHWLHGAGQPDLLRALGLSATPALAWLIVTRRLALPLYLLTCSQRLE